MYLWYTDVSGVLREAGLSFISLPVSKIRFHWWKLQRRSYTEGIHVNLIWSLEMGWASWYGICSNNRNWTTPYRSWVGDLIMGSGKGTAASEPQPRRARSAEWVDKWSRTIARPQPCSYVGSDTQPSLVSCSFILFSCFHFFLSF